MDSAKSNKENVRCFSLVPFKSTTVLPTKLPLYVSQAKQPAALNLFDLRLVRVLHMCNCEQYSTGFALSKHSYLNTYNWQRPRRWTQNKPLWGDYDSSEQNHSLKWWLGQVGNMYYITLALSFLEGRDTSVGIATRYGLDGPGIESRWGQDFPHLSRPALGHSQPPIQWVLGLSRG